MVEIALCPYNAFIPENTAIFKIAAIDCDDKITCNKDFGIFK